MKLWMDVMRDLESVMDGPIDYLFGRLIGHSGKE